MASSWLRFKAWRQLHRNRLIVFGLVASLAVLLLWPNMVVSINSGQAGVLYSRLFGGTVMNKVYGEGLRFILPWDVMFIYDIRLREESITVKLLSKEGLEVSVELSVRYYPLRDKLPQLHQLIGPNYRDKLVAPIIIATTQEVLGDYRPEQYYTGSAQKLQDDILAEAVEAMGRKPVVLDGLLIKRVILPEKIAEAITTKMLGEQEYLRYHYELLTAREAFKKKFIEGESQRAYMDKVAPGLTEQYLRWASIEAIRDLAKSTNAKVVVMGGKDGTPIILNPEGPSSAEPRPPAAAKPAAPTPNAAKPQASDPQARQQSPSTLREVEERLRVIDDMLNKFNDLVIPLASPDKPRGGLVSPDKDPNK